MNLKKMASKFGIAIFLSLLVSTAFANNEVRRQTRLTGAQQCRFERLSASQPSQRVESEAGVIELWDEFEEQFQCAGVAPMRKVLQPDALLLPSYHPNPRLVYIQQGEGLLGISLPGCPESFHSEQQQMESIRQGRAQRIRGGEEQERVVRGQEIEHHQKVHRVRRGDIVALPAGAAHWVFNDGNEQLVCISMNDLNHQANQLDHKFREFFLAGGVPISGQQGYQRGQQRRMRGGQQDMHDTFQNILRAFDTELLSEAYNVRPDIIERIQRDDERGLIVNAREMRGILKPDEEDYQRRPTNGMEETFCSMKIRTNIDNIREAETYSREAGKINIVNRYKLPILRAMDMSAEKGNLYQNAMTSPHWSVNGHGIVYVTRGEAQVQIVDHNGQTVMNDRVAEGDMFVVPQYFTSTFRADRNEFEWVSFKTTGEPMKSPLVGYTSVMRALPLQVMTNAYQISPREAQDLKINRGGESFLLSSGRRS